MEINGLPLHPLVVHAAVVFAPVAALAAILHAMVPAWRARLRWPVLVLALVATASVVAAYLTGRQFLASRPELGQSPAVLIHETRARQLLWVTIGFGVVALAAAWLTARTGALRVVLDVLLALGAVAVLVLVFRAGEAGARAVWG